MRLWLATMADVLRAAPGQHLDILWRDLRFATRSMLGRPAHTLTAVITLAIGIGANVAMFAVVDGVLLAPLDYRDADRLVAVAETKQGQDPVNMGYLSFVDLKSQARSVTHLVAATQSTATFSGGGQDAERVNAMRVSRDYFDLVGVQPRLGRAFTAAEDMPGAARRVVILSDGLWRRRFAADPGVIGRPVVISDIPHVIVGVMPAGFDDIVASRFYKDAGLWFPLGYDPAASFACRTCRHLRVLGRLAPGATPEAAEAELTQLFARMAAAEPAAYTNPGARVTRLHEVFLGPVRPALLLLWGGVAVLLLVACANVASLLLLRASERSTEVAVRAALGVTPARLVRQLLTESVLMSAAGALLGLLPAWAVVRLIASAGPRELPRLAGLSLDARAVTVAVLLAMASGLLFGLAPLRQLTRRAAGDELRGAGRRTGGVGMWRARAVLVAGNVAMATVLLAGSGVLVRSVTRLLSVEPGVNPQGVLTMRLWAGGERFNQGDTPQQVASAVAFYDDVLSRVRALPGVVSASSVTTLPLGGDIDSFGFHVAGRLTANPADAPSADRFVVTSDYFATMGIPLVRGRLIDARDGPQAERVALINRTAADTMFAGEDPIGRQVMIGPATAPPRTIVGIVGDVRHRGLDLPVEPQVYVPQAQWVWAETLMTLVVRTTGDPLVLAGAVRGVIRDVDPAQPVTDVQSYADVVAAHVEHPAVRGRRVGRVCRPGAGAGDRRALRRAQRHRRAAADGNRHPPGPGRADRGHPSDGVPARPAARAGGGAGGAARRAGRVACGGGAAVRGRAHGSHGTRWRVCGACWPAARRRAWCRRGGPRESTRRGPCGRNSGRGVSWNTPRNLRTPVRNRSKTQQHLRPGTTLVPLVPDPDCP